MCPYHTGSLVLISLGLGILIGSACGSGFMTLVLVVGCTGCGCYTLFVKK